MQAIFLGFIWISLLLFGRRTPFGGWVEPRGQGGSGKSGARSQPARQRGVLSYGLVAPEKPLSIPLWSALRGVP
jgi:hypothetical protein